MKFLFLVGAEGSGHHMFRAILGPHIASSWFSFEGNWHGPLTELWDESISWERFSGFSDRQVHFEQNIRPILTRLQNRGVTHCYENASFPFNNPRNPLRRPDLVEFDRLMGGIADCRYLVLYRDPVSMAASAMRRGFTDNPYLQCKILEDNLIYIAAQMGLLGVDRYRTLCFEAFVADPERYADSLAGWWELDSDLLKSGIKNLRAPGSSHQSSQTVQSILSGFFDGKRIEQWARFYRENPLA